MKRVAQLLPIAALLLAGCHSDPATPSGPTGTQEIDGLEVTSLSGTIKAGVDITLRGTGWDELTDEIWFVKDTDTTFIVNQNIVFADNKITFGIYPSDVVVGKSGVTAWLYRDDEHALFKLGEDLTVSLPGVEDGWIPDPEFRTLLMGKYESLFDKYGMLDVEGAAAINSTDDFMLADCQAVSFSGIEHFKNIAGNVRAWGCPNLEEADFSKNASVRDMSFERCPKLKSIKPGPNTGYVNCWGDEALTHIDISYPSRVHTFNAYENGSGPAVELLDARRIKADGGEAITLVFFQAADNAVIKISSWAYNSLWSDGDDNRPGGWRAIYKAWKEHNATVEVYDYDAETIDVLLFTVAPYSEDPEAIGRDADGNPFKKPGIEDGWIPDAEFRKSLKNALGANVFDENDFVKLDVAATITGDLNVADSQAKSFAGVELFPNLDGQIFAWNCPNLEEADFSKNTKLGNININGCPKLAKLVPGPETGYVNAWGDVKLTRIEIPSPSKVHTFNAYENGQGPAVELLDARRLHSGTASIMVFFQAADDCLIKINNWAVNNMWSEGDDNRPGGWRAIYKAWKEHNATVEVYDGDNIETLLYTVKKYSEDPEALRKP